MKRFIVSLVIIGIIVVTGCSSRKTLTLSLSGAFALYPLAVKWSEEYKKVNPGIEFDISAGGAGKGMTDTLSGMVDIGMVSREISDDEKTKGAWALSVAIDAVVPVMNRANPLFFEIQKYGLKKSEFALLWQKSSPKSWRDIKPVLSSESAVNVYTRSDSCGAAQTWGAFIGLKQEQLGGTGVFGDPGIAEAVRKDPLGAGYNNISFAYDGSTKKPVEGLAVIPIDIDENGIIEDSERLYDDRETLTAAIAEGRYPSPPARKLYFVVNGKPESAEIRTFLAWVLGDGQRFIAESGYVELLAEELEKNRALLK